MSTQEVKTVRKGAEKILPRQEQQVKIACTVAQAARLIDHTSEIPPRLDI